MKAINSIDLNADLGEFKTEDEFNNEVELLQLISSCNIACGGHIGDRSSISRVIEQAEKFNVAIGMHPSYPDKLGFGRKPVVISDEELQESLYQQIDDFLTVASQHSILEPYHIKLHGQLYNDASKNRKLGEMILSIIQDFELSLLIHLPFVGQCNSMLEDVCKLHNHPFVAEAFVDRRYNPDLTLVQRSQADAMIDSVNDQVLQAKQIVIDRSIIVDNRRVKIRADTLCIHGDHPGALTSLRVLRSALEAEGIEIKYYA
jgi:UPF0271 protein